MKSKRIRGFTDVNDELEEIRKLERLVETKRKKADAAIAIAEERLEEETKGWLAEIERHKASIEKFCRNHFAEFGGKSKKFEAGTVLFRDSDELLITDSAKTLRLLGECYPDGFAVKRTIDVIALKRLGDDDLKKLGALRIPKSICVIRTVKE